MIGPLGPSGWRVFAFFLLLQAGQESGPGELLKLLGSGDPAERDLAYDRLKSRGESARPWLEKGVRDPDSEVAARAGTLLRRIDIPKELPAGMGSLGPETLDQLAQGDGPEWVSLYTRLLKLQPRSRACRLCLEKYSARAFRSATTPDEKKALCEALWSGDWRAFPEVLKLLRDPGEGVRQKAAETLGNFRAFECEGELAALLEDALPATRIAAAQALGTIFEKDSLPLLLPLLGDPSPEMRRSVALILKGFRWENGESVLPIVAPLLKDPDPEVRENAISILGESASREAAPLLLPSLEDKEAGIRTAGALALGRIGAPDAALGLRRLLRGDPESSVRHDAAWALGAIGVREAVPELLGCLQDRKEEILVRAAAAEALATLKAGEALSAGRALLGAPEPGLRLAAVRLLVDLDDHDSAGAIARRFREEEGYYIDSLTSLLVEKSPSWLADSLLPLLEEPSWKVRHGALLVLSRVRHEKVMAAIVRRLGDPQVEVRNAAMLGSLWVGTPQADGELRKLLRHETPDVRRRAVENILPLLGPGGAKELVPLLGDPSPLVRASATRALGSLERPEDLPRFVRLVGDPDGSVRSEASKAISLQRGWSAVPDLKAMSRIGPEDVRLEVVRLLLDLGDSEHDPEILSLLNSASAPVRKEALRLFPSRGVKEGARPLLPFLGSSNSEVRATAIETVAALGMRDLCPQLRPFLKDPDTSIRTAALQALADLDDRESIPAVLELLHHGDAQGACDFLASLGVREAAPQLEEVLESGESAFCESLRALARLGARTSARRVFEHLGQRRDWGENSVPLALGTLGAREFIPALREKLKHRYAGMRLQAAIALGELGATEAAADLLPLLKDRDQEVVAAAADALGRLGAREAIPGIRAALRERDWSPEMTWWITCGVAQRARRGALLEALVRLKAREAVPDLLQELQKEPAPFHLDIVAALRLLREPTAQPALLEHLSKTLDPRSNPKTWPEEWGRGPRFLLYGDLDFLTRAQYSIAELVADLEAKEFIPDLVRLLRVGPRDIRRSAAKALCLLGSDEGVGLILLEAEHGERGGLFSLNALRRPTLWGRMREKRLPRTGSLSVRELWQDIARTLGLRLEMPPESCLRPSSSAFERFDVRVYEELFPLLDVARELVARFSCQMILEEDRIRLVRDDEAASFWKAWRKP